jgi:hypothetical protein
VNERAFSVISVSNELAAFAQRAEALDGFGVVFAIRVDKLYEAMRMG